MTPASSGAASAALLSAKALRWSSSQLRQRLLDHGDIGQRHAHARDTRMGRDQRMQVIEIVGDQETRERQIGERRLGGPVAHQAGQAGGLELALTVGRQDLVGAAHDAGDVFGLVAAHRTQVRAKTQITRNQLDRSAGFARGGAEQLCARPLLEGLARSRHAQAIAGVVQEHQLEAGQKLRVEKSGQADETTAQGKAVGDIAVQHELTLRAAFIRQREFTSPLRRVAFERHRSTLLRF